MIMEETVQNQELQTKKPSLIGMITNPVEQFTRMKEKPTFIAALIIVTIAMSIMTAMITYFTMKSTPDFTGTSAEGQSAMLVFGVVGTAIVGLFVTPIIFLITSGFYKLCFMVMGNDTSFKHIFAMVVNVAVISVLGLVVNGILAAIIGGEVTSYTSLGSLMDQGTFLGGFLSSFEFFNIWRLIVLGIGFYVVGGLSKNKIIVLLSIVFILSALLGGVGGFFTGYFDTFQ